MAEKTVTFAMVLGLLGSPTFFDGILWIARAVEGEMGGCFPQEPEVGAWIAHTVLNRIDSPKHSDDPETVVRKGFLGHIHAPDPEPEAYITALMSTLAHAQGHDPTEGALYLFSFQDIEKLQFDRNKAIRCFEGVDIYGICFFREMP